MEDVCEGKDFSFPREEEKILQLWARIDAFRTQLKRTEGLPEYIFYDGPPFATGLPHYGHILAGTIKDIVTRYQTATGHHVTRRFGWDCHGLPVEYEIDQKLGIRTRDDVLAMGIDKYNEECRSIVMRYAKEWEAIVQRVGRWIDFENDYKTLDRNYMESVWWVFQQLHHKGLVYRGYKVMPYSTGCKTPLSNFEAGLNYKDVSDPAIMVSFPIEGDPDGASLVAWTTTPWTLPSNLALCVNPSFSYAKVRSLDSGAVWIVAQCRVSTLPAAPKKAQGTKDKEKGKGAKDAGDAKEQEQAPDKNPADNAKNGEAGAAAGAPGKKGKKGRDKKQPEAQAQAVANGGGPGEGGPPGLSALDTSAYELLGTLSGADLAGKRYTPLFPYFKDMEAVAFKVVADGFVTDDSGSGVVHCAPAFGEDDYRVCVAHGIIKKGEEVPNPVDQDGNFTAPVSDFQGQFVKDADKAIIAAVKAKGRLVSSGSIMHSYPFCWRSETPLLYKVVPSWFVAVEKIKERLLANNAEGTYWVPEAIKEKRFHNWLENARDWAVSRSRFWGTPLPIWASPDGQEIRVIGSVAELEALSGAKISDLHRHFIDGIEIPNASGTGTLRRVEDVFDCWFESGSMPYAYIHYPFENKELFDRNFPGHFVAEGLDQTRGWFYTLMVLSTALFDKPAFRNLICNGLVLAEDGKKMSKRLKNYPPPMEVVNDYGADALRLYLINSPVVRAEPLRFKKDGVHALLRDVFLPWYNAYRFLTQNVLRLQSENEALPPFQPLSLSHLAASSNPLDQWILSATQSLVQFVRQEMEAYRLYTVVPKLLKFIDRLTNVYVRFNRKRLKGRTGADDCHLALSTLFHVLLTTCKTMCPFTPFFTETMFQNLRRALGPSEAEESVHFCSFPISDQKIDARIERSVERMMTVIDCGRNIRERHNRPLKTPLKEMVVVHTDTEFLEDITGKLHEYVTEELNVRSLVPCNDPLQYSTLKAEPDFSVLGKRLGRSMGAVGKEVKAMDAAAIGALQAKGEVVVAGQRILASEIKVTHDFKAPEGIPKGDIDAAGDGEVLVVLDLRPDTDLLEAGAAREVVNRVQKLRKKAGLEPQDAVEVFIAMAPGETSAASASAHGPSSSSAGGNAGLEREGPLSPLELVLQSQAPYIVESLGVPILPLALCPAHAVVLAREAYSGVAGASFSLLLTRPALCFASQPLLSLCQGDDVAANGVQVVLLSRDPVLLRQQLEKDKGKVSVSIDGLGSWEVVRGTHLFLSAGELSAASQQ